MLALLREALHKADFQMPLAQHLGFRLTRVDPGLVTVSFTPQDTHRNIMGTVHGGILCSAADAAMGLAYATLAPEGSVITTVELKINYLRPVFHQTVHAHGSSLHHGRSTGLLQCHMQDDDGKLLAYATCTCMVVQGDSARNREVLPDFIRRGERPEDGSPA
jgi:uncharacterized protein (TIGR00369 family)